MEREKEEHNRTNELLRDTKRDLHRAEDEIEDKTHQLEQSQKKVLEVEVEKDNHISKQTELEVKLKQAEQRCHELYQEVMNSNSKGMERWKDMQVKYEDSQTLINKQLSAIETLNSKISDLRDVNN